MIPAKADDEQMAHYIANITAAYDAATLEQRDRGRNWYPVAHDLALIIGDGDVRKGAGILAVFSANKRWRDTVRLAQDASDGFLHGHTGVTLAKAARGSRLGKIRRLCCLLTPRRVTSTVPSWISLTLTRWSSTGMRMTSRWARSTGTGIAACPARAGMLP